MITPSIYDSFNASQTDTKELCESFIANEHYDTLMSPNHVVMIGPRGSGKTTLLRMLQVDSLDQWRDGKADYYRDNIHYSGVFVPTDRYWKDKYNQNKEFFKDKPYLENILHTIFVYHVLFRIVNSLRYLSDRDFDSESRYRFISLTKKEEVELVSELSVKWKLSPSRNSLRSLASALLSKNDELANYIDMPSSDREGLPSFFSGDVVAIIKNSIKTINLFMPHKSHKWAILFDELELAPEPIVNSLIKGLRGSGTENVIFKLAMSPYHENVSLAYDPIGPMRLGDYVRLNIAHFDEKTGMLFSQTLSQQIFSKNGLEEKVCEYFEESIDLDATGKNKKQSRQILKEICSELSQKDASFKEYLDHKKIDINEIPNYDESVAPQLRKFKFVAAIRNYYMKDDGSFFKRKRPYDYYGGFYHICKSLEYNPRMLIGIMSVFAKIAKNKKKIGIPEQLQELSKFHSSFVALLETIAVSEEDSLFKNVYDLIDAIGNRFSNEIFRAEFNDDPKGTIIFKSDLSQKYSSAIGSAMNAGAIVRVSNSDEKNEVNDIRSARCRLSFLFAHYYRLTLNIQREMEFSQILKKDDCSSDGAASSSRQLELL